MTFPLALVSYALILYWKPGQWGVFQQTVGYTVTEVLYASGLVLTLAYKSVALVLSAPALRFFGKFSYALYVFHPFVFVQTDNFLARHRFGFATSSEGRLLAFSVIALGGSIVAALISWYALESPCMRWKRLFSYDAAASQSGRVAVAHCASGPK